jgi:hypothetical protein
MISIMLQIFEEPLLCTLQVMQLMHPAHLDLQACLACLLDVLCMNLTTPQCHRDVLSTHMTFCKSTPKVHKPHLIVTARVHTYIHRSANHSTQIQLT